MTAAAAAEEIKYNTYTYIYIVKRTTQYTNNSVLYLCIYNIISVYTLQYYNIMRETKRRERARGSWLRA